MSRIFISHSSKNDHWALALREWLAEEGWSDENDVFLDIHADSGLVAGQRWLDALEQATNRCEAVVFLVSKAWLASKWCNDEYQLAKELNKKLFALLLEDVKLSDLPGGLVNQWQIVRLFGEPHKRYKTIHPITKEFDVTYLAEDGCKRLANGLKKAGISPDSFELQPDSDGPFGWRSPYRGLKALEFEDAAVFFGRDADLVRGIDRLRGLASRSPPRMLVILGASGAGKSSYLRAGLLPRINRDDATWVQFKPIRVIRGGAIEGEEGLISALKDVYKWFDQSVNRAELRESLQTESGFIEQLQTIRVLAAERLLADEITEQPLPVLSIDQAEELFAVDAGQDAKHLLRLIRAAMFSGDLVFLATIRSDNYSSLQDAELLQGIHQNTLSLAPVPAGEIAGIIRRPAEVLREKAGPESPVFSAEVIAKLQKEMKNEEDALPLLAFALQRLMREHDATATIGEEELKQTGGVNQAIQITAQQALEKVIPDSTVSQQAQLLNSLFIPRLVRIDRVSKDFQRKVPKLSQFDDPQAAKLLEALVERRLLVKKGIGDEVTVEIAHEALLRRWPQLVKILEKERDSLLLLEGVQHAADDWSNAKGDDKTEFLNHRGNRLQEAIKLLKDEEYEKDLEEKGKNYIHACEKREKQKELEGIKRAEKEQKQAQQRKRLQKWLSFAIIASAIVTIIGGFLVIKGNQDLSLQRSQFLATEAEAEFESGQYDRAMRLALVAKLKTVLISKTSIAANWVLGRSAHFSRLNAQLEGHIGRVYSASFSPDGHRIVTASADRTARVWAQDEQGQWASTALEGHISSVVLASFSPDGHRIVTASADGTVRVWAQDKLGVWESTALEGHTDSIYSVSFSPDSQWIVTASADHTVRVWAQDKQGVWESTALEGHADSVISVRFSPDGSRIVTASADDTARVWTQDVRGVWESTALVGHTVGVNSASFSTDGQRIVTASADGTVRVWAQDKQGVWASMVLGGHTGGVNSASFSPDGHQVMAVSRDGPVRVWTQPEQGLWRFKALEGQTDKITSAMFSPDGHRIVTASADDTVRVWVQGEQGIWASTALEGHIDRVYSASFSPDGHRIVTASADGTARVWTQYNQGVWASTVLEGYTSSVVSASFSPDDHRIVTVSRDDTVRVWVQGEQGIWASTALEGHIGRVYSSSFSPDGHRIVTASADRTVRVWVQDKQGVWASTALDGHTGRVYSASFSPDGHRIVTASADRTARVWAQDEQGIWASTVLEGHTEGVYSASFSPDGHRIVTASDYGTVRVWAQDEQGQWASTALGGNAGSVFSVRFSPDGRRIVTVSRNDTVRIWVQDKQGVWASTTLDGHAGSVFLVRFSPDGHRIVTVSADRTVRVWVQDKQGIWASTVLEGYTGRVNSASFSPDGHRIVTASDYGTVRVWAQDEQGQWASTALGGHTDRVNSVSFSANGRRIVTASTDRTARVWDMKWLASEQNRKALELKPLAVAVCEEKLRGTVKVINPDSDNPVYKSVRHLSKEDIEAAPILRGREGEDVCAPILNSLSFWKKLGLWITSLISQ